MNKLIIISLFLIGCVTNPDIRPSNNEIHNFNLVKQEANFNCGKYSTISQITAQNDSIKVPLTMEYFELSGGNMYLITILVERLELDIKEIVIIRKK